MRGFRLRERIELARVSRQPDGRPCQQRSEVAAVVESSKFLRQSLVINGLADDVAQWTETSARYRLLAIAAIEAVSQSHQQIRRLQESNQALREELRRYTAREVTRP